MNFLIILFLLYFLTVVETSLIPLNLILALVIVLSLRMKTPLSLVAAFAGGLFYDSISGHRLGLSSLMMLLTSGLYLYLKEKFSLTNPLFRFILTFLVYTGYQLANAGAWQIKEAMIMAIIVTILTQTKEEVVKL